MTEFEFLGGLLLLLL